MKTLKICSTKTKVFIIAIVMFFGVSTKGQYAVIRFDRNDTKKILTISEREGRFPGMLKERSFNIVLVQEGHGKGIEICTSPDKTVRYNGKK